MFVGRHVKHPLFVSYFNETWDFMDRFSKNPQTSNFMKVRPIGAEWLHADGRQTDTRRS
jgi:hypothetical protein